LRLTRGPSRFEGCAKGLLASSSSSARPLEAWFADVRHADWDGPADVKADFGSTVDFVGDNRVIFDIAGNRYRLIVHIAYRFKRVLVKFVGTHAEYNRIDPETIR
jgi:mRNA interferase HigB